MILSKVHLRWYKSFNTIFDSTKVGAEWDKVGDERFPYVSIPLDKLITTVVGANESGKSHLLSAISKALTGRGVGRERNRGLAIQDICRHCSFDSLGDEVNPSIGFTLEFEGKNSDDSLAALLAGLQLGGASTNGTSATIILNGPDDSEKLVTVYAANGQSLGSVSGSKWYEYSRSKLPDLRYIEADLRLANSVHIQNLLSTYDSATWPATVIYDHRTANSVADDLTRLSIPTEETPIGPLAATLIGFQSKLKANAHPVPDSLYLEKLLFQDILKISKDHIVRIRDLSGQHRGYVERVVADINQRLSERLDLATYWTQDSDLILELDYKAEHFYFQLRDKTGSKFTFNERSSGLQFFLSYYIQSLAYKLANTKRGMIVLMDEPDGFLSAIAQQNLLKVFDSIVASGSPQNGRCQLIYTTHSPFLINRNFPTRLRLVKKGVGTEGTQYVDRSLARRYEPVRSALGIDCAETIFMGTTNVLLEGASDQRVIVGGIRFFGTPEMIGETLDLNGITFVSGNGAPSLKQLLQKTKSLDEQKPVFVVLLDGDATGHRVAQEMVAEDLATKDVILTLDQCGIGSSGNEPKVIEELIPKKMVFRAIAEYCREGYAITLEETEIEKHFADATQNTAGSICACVRAKIGAEASDMTDVEIRSSVTSIFIESILERDEFVDSEEMKAFRTSIEKLIVAIKKLIASAEARGRKATLERHYRLEIEPFFKLHSKAATKYDVSKLLLTLLDHSTYAGDSAGLARSNIITLQEMLDTEATAASQPIDSGKWKRRFEHLRGSPFSIPKSGWKELA